MVSLSVASSLESDTGCVQARQRTFHVATCRLQHPTTSNATSNNHLYRNLQQTPKTSNCTPKFAPFSMPLDGAMIWARDRERYRRLISARGVIRSAAVNLFVNTQRFVS